MFGRRFSLGSNTAQPDDGRLSALLDQWKSIEPQANFEAVVWRRIRAASAPEQQPLPVAIILRDWFVPRSAWVNAAAVAAGILVGVGLAFFAPAARGGRHANEPLLHAQTLAGSYLTMVTGGPR